MIDRCETAKLEDKRHLVVERNNGERRGEKPFLGLLWCCFDKIPSRATFRKKGYPEAEERWEKPDMLWLLTRSMASLFDRIKISK